ncbi:MAG: YkgJ family cysteine cluster protein [Bacteroidales bacterium]|nr:YkgJ family cysteine cluster protein [Bacteroidales bacterium]
MNCRPGCGACCIIPSISSFIPGMPDGKPAGVRCIHLTSDLKCALYNSGDRPQVCQDFKADPVVCGETREDAIKALSKLEGL